MMREYIPRRNTSASTRSARLSYALGIVRGVQQEVTDNLAREEERRKRKLEKQRAAVSTGEACELSDDGSDNECDTGEFVSDDSPDVAIASDAPPAAKRDVDSAEKASSTCSDKSKRPDELERQESAALALVDHSVKVAEEVLKEHDIKLGSARRRRRIQRDQTLFDQGVEDSKEIDMNQRAIRDEVKLNVRSDFESRTDSTVVTTNSIVVT